MTEPTDLDRLDLMLAGTRDAKEQVRRLMASEKLPTDYLRSLDNLYDRAQMQLHVLRGIADGQASKEQSP